MGTSGVGKTGAGEQALNLLHVPLRPLLQWPNFNGLRIRREEGGGEERERKGAGKTEERGERIRAEGIGRGV